MNISSVKTSDFVEAQEVLNSIFLFLLNFQLFMCLCFIVVLWCLEFIMLLLWRMSLTYVDCI
jgi:hypothetical protein